MGKQVLRKGGRRDRPPSLRHREASAVVVCFRASWFAQTERERQHKTVKSPVNIQGPRQSHLPVYLEAGVLEPVLGLCSQKESTQSEPGACGRDGKEEECETSESRCPEWRSSTAQSMKLPQSSLAQTVRYNIPLTFEAQV